jgi:hypothetical protein
MYRAILWHRILKLRELINTTNIYTTYIADLHDVSTPRRKPGCWLDGWQEVQH